MANTGVRPSIWTPANIVTCVRVAGVPLWLLAAQVLPASDGSTLAVGALVTLVLFAFLSLTDTLDGYLARSRNEVTDFGKFLDPIADKLVVIVALCFLLEVGMVSSWVLLVVVAREFLVSGLRMVVASKGEVVAANNLGKAKTAVTMVAICVLLLERALPVGGFLDVVTVVGTVSLWAAVILTIWSGAVYFLQCWPYVNGTR